MNIRLPDSLSSRQDLKQVIVECHRYTAWLNQLAVKDRVGISGSTNQPAVSALTADIINGWHAARYQTQPGSGINQKGMAELIIELEELIETAPRIIIALAAMPTKQIKNTLVSWCRRNIHANTLVDFEFDSTMGGGLVVRAGSRIYDWSFRSQILAALNKFPEVLRNV